VRRLPIGIIATVGALGLMAGPAGADPTGAKNALVFSAQCGAQSVDVVVNGSGEWSPAHVLGTNRVFQPVAFDLTFTFTPTGGPTFTETDVTEKRGPNQPTQTCTIDASFTTPDGVFTLSGTVVGVFYGH